MTVQWLSPVSEFSLYIDLHKAGKCEFRNWTRQGSTRRSGLKVYGIYYKPTSTPRVMYKSLALGS